MLQSAKEKTSESYSDILNFFETSDSVSAIHYLKKLLISATIIIALFLARQAGI